MTLAEVIQQLAADISTCLGVTVDASMIEVANPKAGSHLAFPTFRFAKELSMSPPDIAAKVQAELTSEQATKIEATGPYVNVWLKPEVLVDIVTGDDLKDANANGKTAIVEFLSPNLAKPLSIGHFRNAMQGRLLVRLLKNEGYTVITDNHIGDWGTVFGMWVVGFQRFSSEEQLQADGVKELGRMYVEVRQALKEDNEDAKAMEAEIQEWLQKLEAGDEEAWAYHKKFSDVSLKAVHAQMAELGVTFDYNYGESFYIKRAKEMVEELLANGKATKNDDGSVIIELNEQDIDTPMLIEKANGAALYATSDIATIEFREKEWNPDIVAYVVGAEQQFHFKQLFAANQKCGWSDAELVHHSYGLIEELDEDGGRRKMSSRSKAIYMDDLLKLAIDRAHAVAPEGLSEDDIQKIAYAGLSFREASVGHNANTLFDWDEMFSLSGYSGPYVQYAVVRIKSILEKAGSAGQKPESYDWSNESELLWKLSQFETAVRGAEEAWEGVKLAEYSYELARAWNRYYDAHKIIGSGEDEQPRLWLASVVKAHLERALYLLGIEIPSRM